MSEQIFEMTQKGYDEAKERLLYLQTVKRQLSITKQPKRILQLRLTLVQRRLTVKTKKKLA